MNEQTVGMLADAFDAVVELHEGREGTEYRVIGLDAPRAWATLSL